MKLNLPIKKAQKKSSRHWVADYRKRQKSKGLVYFAKWVTPAVFGELTKICSKPAILAKPQIGVNGWSGSKK